MASVETQMGTDYPLIIVADVRIYSYIGRVKGSEKVISLFTKREVNNTI